MEKVKVLLLENINPVAEEEFRKAGYEVRAIPFALGEDELVKEIKGISVLGIRSNTQITPFVLAQADTLKTIGTYTIGKNHINLESCEAKGISVFNDPYSSARSVVELAIAEIILLMRNLVGTNNEVHNGIWNKSATGKNEVREKKLGILGYGNIGSQLSVIAEALGMEVYFYDLLDKDPLGNSKKCGSLSELLNSVDVLTLHVDGRIENRNLIGEKELKMMSRGSYLINLSRGHVVNLPDLIASLKSGHLAGAGIDVFLEEPYANNKKLTHELQGLNNVILTPHIGGSTQESQRRIALYVSGLIIDYLKRSLN